MSQKEIQSPPLDTAAGLLLTLTALSGEFPTTLVSRLPGGDAYKTKVIKRLKKDGLLRTYYADGLRGFRLTATAKKLLLEGWPDQFSSCLTGCTETNTLKSEPLRRLRLHRMAEVLVTMYNASVAVFPWQNPLYLALYRRQTAPGLNGPPITTPGRSKKSAPSVTRSAVPGRQVYC